MNAALTADPLGHLILDVIKEAHATERRASPRWSGSGLYGRRSRTVICKRACRAMNGHQPPAMADRKPHGSVATPGILLLAHSQPASAERLSARSTLE